MGADHRHKGVHDGPLLAAAPIGYIAVGKQWRTAVFADCERDDCRWATRAFRAHEVLVVDVPPSRSESLQRLRYGLKAAQRIRLVVDVGLIAPRAPNRNALARGHERAAGAGRGAHADLLTGA
ncbi:hypothetical protein BKG82_12780 [Mycobacteroides chelonae]|uniref:Uncharacterized protein n=1 Tax=Mycobacteroides chelonae TaxID=1774 RepID=A0A1S1LQR2_MYCCH|nr:hypothetical protein BKG82_12780 [Mycobacteroides chelonae]